MFDVRFLPNPHYESELRPKTGLDPEVVEYVERSDGIGAFYDHLMPLLDYLLPQYEQEGKAHLTIGIGCTGGRHRSVVIAERLARLYGERGRLPGGRRPPRHRQAASAPVGGRQIDSRFTAERRKGLSGMALKAGINGFGRIGRNVFRAAHARGADIDWVGVNDITDTETLAHLLKYDSILGPFPGTVEAGENGLVVDGDELRVFAERDPADLPWERRRRRRGDRVDRPVHRPPERGREAPGRRREEGDHHRAGQGAGRDAGARASTTRRTTRTPTT